MNVEAMTVFWYGAKGILDFFLPSDSEDDSHSKIIFTYNFMAESVVYFTPN